MNTTRTVRAQMREIAAEVTEAAKWIHKDFDNSAIIESEIRALRAAADKLEALNR